MWFQQWLSKLSLQKYVIASIIPQRRRATSIHTIRRRNFEVRFFDLFAKKRVMFQEARGGSGTSRGGQTYTV